MRVPGPDENVDDLLAEFRGPGPCGFCGEPCRNREAAHVLSRGAGEVTVRINLVALGGPWDCACHHDSHLGHRPRQADLLGAVEAREGIPADEIITYVHLIRRLPNGSDWEGILEALYARYGRTYPRSPRRLPGGRPDPAGRDEAGDAGVLRRPPVGEAGGVPADQDGWHHY